MLRGSFARKYEQNGFLENILRREVVLAREFFFIEIYAGIARWLERRTCN